MAPFAAGLLIMVGRIWEAALDALLTIFHREAVMLLFLLYILALSLFSVPYKLYMKRRGLWSFSLRDADQE